MELQTDSRRHYTLLDKVLITLDQGLRTITGMHTVADRENPAEYYQEAALAHQEKKHIAGLMRVNHTGEVCAQALYQGQACTARLAGVRAKMEQSAQEEIDHLAWCSQRLSELESHPSYLNGFWYLGSFTIGALAGAAGDRWSLGFVVETERQVVDHLTKHLGELPVNDRKSRAILEAMRQDESHHATVALESGGVKLPAMVKQTMKLTSKVMTTISYWI